MKKLYQIIIISVLILIGLLNGVKGQGREREEAIEFDKLPFTDTSDDCIVEVGGKYLIKRRNETWIDPLDPCKIHKCELGLDGFPTENQFRESCYLTCSNEYEMQTIQGQCCGRCVKTKCKFNGAMYEVGETWKSPDDCVMFECVQGDEDVKLMNYTKACPPVPRNCKLENIYVKDCCRLCSRSPFQRKLVKVQDQSSIYPDSYTTHPCKRTCQKNEAPRICKYTFTMEWYQAMSRACFDCPQNASHCSLPHCITGDGTQRSVMVINRMMPGPTVEVCFGDTVMVDVQNHLMGDTTTIHWHGLHQRETPYMDGVPFISQCGIQPEQTFRYEFKADNVGTHFWHSHTGMQRGDGAFGALIIKQPIELDVHRGLYDVDSSDHHILLQDWDQVVGISMFNAHHHAKGINKPRSILINGKGRLVRREQTATEARNIIQTTAPDNPYPPSSAIMKIRPEKVMVPRMRSSSGAQGQDTIETMGIDQTTPEDVDIADAELFSYPPSEKIQTDRSLMIDPVVVEDEEEEQRTETPVQSPPEEITIPIDTSTTVEVTEESITTTELPTAEEPGLEGEEELPPKENIGVTLVRQKRNLVEGAELIPLHVFTVQSGKRSRFRLINAEFLNCPMELSIDNHTMTMIASDGSDFVPIVVDAFVSYAGERFDFILHANQPVGNYWIRIKGLMDCDERFTSAHQTAILRYSEAPEVEPADMPIYNYTRNGVTLNALNRGQEDLETVSIASVQSLIPEDADEDKRLMMPEVDFKFYVYYDFYGKDNFNFHKPNMYGFNQVDSSKRVYSPQLNHISMKLPHLPILPARHMLDESTFCNAASLAAEGRNCREEFCQCPHILEVPLNSTVELVIVDEGYTYDANHPFHLHGNAFRVIGMERLNSSVNLEQIQELDKQGRLKRRLLRAPQKDTVTVPDGGYTIIRFVADNPGYWLFHCHIEFHAEIGMALVFKVGKNSEMAPVPPGFPTCYDYVPNKQRGGAVGVYRNVMGVVLGCLLVLQVFTF